VTIGKYNKNIAARSLSEIAVPSVNGFNDGAVRARAPTVLTVEVYVHERAPSKRSARLAFALSPLLNMSIRLKVIGIMKRTQFFVDVITSVENDSLESPLPPLTRGEAKDLVMVVREGIDIQLAEWARQTPGAELRVCKPIPQDLLDLEVLGS
jgi:hypothetical protein